MHKVYITNAAENDIDSIFQYINTHDCFDNAEYVTSEIYKAILTLAELPNRGNHPNELLEIGITEYREIFFSIYRIFYYVENDSVFVVLVADGRRDMQSILEKRLF